MPGKYSHGVVLAQYSSRGIISLPNDQQLAYDSNSLSYNRKLKTPSRSRAPSFATKSSGRQLGSEQTPPLPHNLSQHHRGASRLSSNGSVSKQRIILDSDSDSDAEGVFSETYGSRSFSKASTVSHATVDNRQPRPSFLEPQGGRDDEDLVVPMRTLPNRINASSIVTGRPTPTNARNLEPRQDARLFTKSQPKQKTNETAFNTVKVQVYNEIGDERTLSLQEFLDTMPAGDKWVSPRTSQDRSTSVSRDPSPLPRGPLQRQLSGNTLRTQIYDPLPDSNELNFDGFSDNDDLEPDFLQYLTVPTRRPGENKQKMQAAQPLRTEASENKSSEAPTSTASGIQTANAETLSAIASKTAELGTTEKSLLARTSGVRDPVLPAEPKPASTITKPPQPSRKEVSSLPRRPSRLDNYATSDDNSSISSFSDFGKPSISRTTLTSRSEYAAQKSSKPNVSEMDWAFPHIEGNDFFDPTVFDESENDIFAARYDSSPPWRHLEDGLPESGFGQISSGRDVMPATDDTISELSAACPPDIERYKYGSADEGPLAQLEKIVAEYERRDRASEGRGRSVESRVARQPSKERGRLRKSGGGFLSKFRRRSQAPSEKRAGSVARE